MALRTHCATRMVFCVAPPGDVLRAVVVDELLVEGHVLVLGEDGVVELHGVLIENVLADLRRDVEERVAHAH